MGRRSYKPSVLASINAHSHLLHLVELYPSAALGVRETSLSRHRFVISCSLVHWRALLVRESQRVERLNLGRDKGGRWNR